VLLLLAALLAAMVGGMLVVGSQHERKLPVVMPPVAPAVACPAGTNPDRPGPAAQIRPALGGGTSWAFDRRAGRLVALGPTDTALETWTFDVCTNTWTRMHPNREPAPGVEYLIYDADSDLTIGVPSRNWEYPEVIGNVWAYDLEANTWTAHGVAPTSGLGFYDPVSGLVFAGEWTYDVETDTWTPNPRGGDCPQQCVYDASVDQALGYAGEEGVVLYDIRTGTLSKSGADTPDCTMHAWAAPAVVYDEAAQRTVVAGADRWGAYDAAADRWEILFEIDGENRPGTPAVYDPTNRRLIVFGGGIGVGGDLVAFDLVNREWTVLLEPGTGKPAPGPE
jgi:hypothetical protein